MSYRPQTPEYNEKDLEKAHYHHDHVEETKPESTLQESRADDITHTTHDCDAGLDTLEVKRLVRKIDRKLIPILSALYCISFIDRTNLSLARSANGKVMNKDLGLDIGSRYSIVTMIFFIPYILLEIPSQIGLRRFGVRWWLASACVLWGVVMLCMGFVKTWGQLAVLRALIGAFEATLFPGATYIIACWYPRKQMAFRNVLFYYMSTVAGGLSAILAYGISQMHGLSNMNGWRWIFIIEGLLTCVIGFCGYIWLQEFPDRATFLTDSERELCKLRIQRDRADAIPDKLTLAKFGRYVIEPKLWIFGFLFGATGTSVYALNFFLPTILQEMGFSNVESQLLFAPPQVWGIIPGLIVAYLCDKYRQRAAGVIFNAVINIVGTCMYSKLPPNQLAARYAGVFLASAGANANIPLVLSWAQTAIRAQSKRAFASGLIVAWGGVSGIFAGVLFIQSEAKRGYPTGMHTILGFEAAMVVLSLVLRIWFAYQNRRADRGEIEIEGHPDFRYQG